MSPHPSVRNVDDWLVIATKDLAPVGKVRICAEIEAHFADGVESHLAEGHSLAQSRDAVLAELGDPFSAGKRFRKRHLTVKEAAFIQTLISRFYVIRLVALLIINAGFPLFAILTLWHPPSLVRIILVATIAALVTTIAIASFIISHRRTAKAIRFAVGIELIDKIFPLCWSWLIFRLSGLSGHWTLLFYGLGAIIACGASWRTFRLWLKTRGSSDVLSEAEPGAGTAASRAGLV